MSDQPDPTYGGETPTLRCPLCAGTEFQREQSRQESRWGFTSHRMSLLVCLRCRYVLHFYDARSTFNVG